MGGIFGGGGGQTQPAVYSQGGNPAPYIPTAQPTADINYQNLLQSLYNPSISSISSIGQLPATQYNPQVQAAVAGITGNPWANAAQAPFDWLTSIAGNTGQQQYNTGTNLLNQIPGVEAAGQQVYNTAFDPQRALYNQLAQQQAAQTNASLAQSGLLGTPYGAGLQNQAAQNLAIGWQNQQLGRQLQGLQALTGSDAAALGLGTGGSQLQNYGANTVQQLSAAPYNFYNQMMGNNLGALSQGINLGNQQFQIPEDVLNYLANYMRLGQGSSELAGQLGQQGFNQQQTGLSNIAGLAGLGSNALFGSQGLTGALGLGSSGLLGSLGTATDFTSGLAGDAAIGDATAGSGLLGLLGLPFGF